MVLMRRGVSMVCLLWITTGCTSSGNAFPRPFPRPGGWITTTVTAESYSATVYSIIATALALKGVAYREGGDTPVGFDCSGFTRYVFGQHGISLPRLAAEQYHAGTPVGARDLQPGDLVFFTTVAPGASHVGMVIHDEEFVHAPSSRGRVRVERISSSYWSTRYVGARRIMKEKSP